MKTTGTHFIALVFFSALLNNASGQDAPAATDTVTTVTTVTVSGLIIYKNNNNNGDFDDKDAMSEGVKISLLFYPAGKVVATTTTNKKGQFSFGSVGEGTYQPLITYPSQQTVLMKSFEVVPADGDLVLEYSVKDRVFTLRFTQPRLVRRGNLPSKLQVTPPAVDKGNLPSKLQFTEPQVVDKGDKGNNVSPFGP